MKSSKIVLALLAAAAVFCGSCLDPVNQPDTSEQNRFWAQRVDGSGTMYQVSARKLFEGTHCVVWGEPSANISAAQAEKIAGEYDRRIYGQMLDAFGMKDFKYTYEDDDEIEHTETFANIMEFAGWLVDEDDKLTILLLDIQDGFKNPYTDPYTAGYFAPRNFFPSVFDGMRTYSNIKSMIYIDTYPTLNSGWVAEEVAWQTLAHEFQHLINFVTSMSKRESVMDTWIDEGLSSQAEVLYSGAPLQSRIDDFNKDYAGTIAKGNNFLVWDNHPEEPAAILDEYATVYLFFRWLYLQAEAAGKQGDLFYRIETSGYSDLQAVTEAAARVVPDWDNWESLLKTWLAANYINNPNNYYGYRNDPAPERTTIRGASTRVTLYPGEGVYSLIENASETTSAVPSNNNIRYAGLGDTSVTELAYPQAEALLTFNMNTTKIISPVDGSETGIPETGYVTGNSLPEERASLVSARSAGFGGPRRLDARDLMGGSAGLFNKFRVKAKK